MHHSRDKLVHLCGKEIGPKYSKENTIRLFFSDGTRCSSGVQLIFFLDRLVSFMILLGITLLET